MKKTLSFLLCIVIILTFSSCLNKEKGNKEAVISIETAYNEKPAITCEEVNFTTVTPCEENDLLSLNCYSTLTNIQKNHYRYMKAMVTEFTEGFVVLSDYYPTFYSDVSVAFHALMNDFPEYYWMPSSYYISTLQEKGSIAFKRSYSDDKFVYKKAQTERNHDEFYEVIYEISEKAAKEKTTYDKAKVLHDELCKRAHYPTNNNNDEEIYSAYGALINGVANCEGYARAFQLLCNATGIENVLVCGNSKSVGHLWNMIKTEDGWYHIDCTWDDLAKNYTYTYFCLTDSQITVDHDIDKNFNQADITAISLGHSFNFNRPTSATAINDYFSKNNLIFESQDTEKMALEIVKQYKSGNNTAHFKFLNVTERENFKANYKPLITAVQKTVNKTLSNKKVKIKTIYFNENTCIILF